MTRYTATKVRIDHKPVTVNDVFRRAAELLREEIKDATDPSGCCDALESASCSLGAARAVEEAAFDAFEQAYRPMLKRVFVGNGYWMGDRYKVEHQKRRIKALRLLTMTTPNAKRERSNIRRAVARLKYNRVW